jgi:hypothetical protein
MKWTHLCASDLTPIEEGQEGIVVVRTRDPENPVSVYVHNNQGCRSNARNHSDHVLAMARGSFDQEGRFIVA